MDSFYRELTPNEKILAEENNYDFDHPSNKFFNLIYLINYNFLYVYNFYIIIIYSKLC
jgi:hypothetical protein